MQQVAGRCVVCGTATKQFRSSGKYAKCCGSALCRSRIATAKVAEKPRDCVICGSPFVPRSHAAKTCSAGCAQRSRNIARGYRQERPCRHCGKAFIPKTPKRKTYCSRECSYAHKSARKEARQAEQVKPHCYVQPCEVCKAYFVSRNPRSTCSDRCTFRKQYKGAPSKIVSCHVCTVEFATTRFNAKYCSKRCCRKAARRTEALARNHAARMRGKTIRSGDRIRPYDVFARDGFKCQICNKKLAMDKKAPHPDSPSIDHIVPLAKGGTHTWANVQAAHFLCNSKKSDQGYAQMRLF